MNIRTLANLVLLVVVGWVLLHQNTVRHLLGRDGETAPAVGSAPPGPAAPADVASGPSPAPFAKSANPSDPAGQAELAVESYMQKYAARGSVLTFLNWSDFSTSGGASAITLRYRVQQPGRDDMQPEVRFDLRGGAVVKAEVIDPGTLVGVAPTVRPVARPFQPAAVQDRFTGPILAARHGPPMTLELSSAFSLGQLERARQKARAERKPLGFIMVWGQFFGHEADTEGKGSDSALVHFYEAFHDQLVLVFVRHETELRLVPPAVGKGFFGPDEGGFAPNMAVTDATATEFIVEIPFRGLDGAGREPLFAAGGKAIDEWLASHPDAIAGSPGATP